VFWGDLTKTAVTIVCYSRFCWNLALWLPTNDTLSTWNFVRISC